MIALNFVISLSLLFSTTYFLSFSSLKIWRLIRLIKSSQCRVDPTLCAIISFLSLIILNPSTAVSLLPNSSSVSNCCCFADREILGESGNGRRICFGSCEYHLGQLDLLVAGADRPCWQPQNRARLSGEHSIYNPSRAP